MSKRDHISALMKGSGRAYRNLCKIESSSTMSVNLRGLKRFKGGIEVYFSPDKIRVHYELYLGKGSLRAVKYGEHSRPPRTFEQALEQAETHLREFVEQD
ncbi:hypothetical protein COU59_00425 [Candidatus Pacearchaeota archaeon CG10_big_fil_rev_8_21_14_0_10_34_12]|nr:MAG: hypothetical protein COU59_00425 [Candidatus Pacearchaeota archaeon CG10_big_fil_rev_8_21_14_0_10_34_12]